MPDTTDRAGESARLVTVVASVEFVLNMTALRDGADDDDAAMGDEDLAVAWVQGFQGEPLDDYAPSHGVRFGSITAAKAMPSPTQDAGTEAPWLGTVKRLAEALREILECESHVYSLEYPNGLRRLPHDPDEIAGPLRVVFTVARQAVDEVEGLLASPQTPRPDAGTEARDWLIRAALTFEALPSTAFGGMEWAVKWNDMIVACGAYRDTHPDAAEAYMKDRAAHPDASGAGYIECATCGVPGGGHDAGCPEGLPEPICKLGPDAPAHTCDPDCLMLPPRNDASGAGAGVMDERSNAMDKRHYVIRLAFEHDKPGGFDARTVEGPMEKDAAEETAHELNGIAERPHDATWVYVVAAEI